MNNEHIKEEVPAENPADSQEDLAAENAEFLAVPSQSNPMPSHVETSVEPAAAPGTSRGRDSMLSVSLA